MGNNRRKQSGFRMLRHSTQGTLRQLGLPIPIARAAYSIHLPGGIVFNSKFPDITDFAWLGILQKALSCSIRQHKALWSHRLSGSTLAIGLQLAGILYTLHSRWWREPVRPQSLAIDASTEPSSSNMQRYQEKPPPPHQMGIE